MHRNALFAWKSVHTTQPRTQEYLMANGCLCNSPISEPHISDLTKVPRKTVTKAIEKNLQSPAHHTTKICTQTQTQTLKCSSIVHATDEILYTTIVLVKVS